MRAMRARRISAEDDEDLEDDELIKVSLSVSSYANEW